MVLAEAGERERVIDNKSTAKMAVARNTELDENISTNS